MLVSVGMMLYDTVPQLQLSLDMRCVMQIQEVAPAVVTKFREQQAQLSVCAQQSLDQQNRPQKRERQALEKVSSTISGPRST